SDAAFDALDCNTLASGDADVINTTLQLILPCLDDVKVLASITSDRIPLTPDAPAIGEIAPDLNIALWNGLFVHKDTPQEARDKLTAA
ncbi:MAG: tripartite tricarboxylate transporter substrate binding protein, partial [Pseudomonadota bacterium]